MFEDVKRGGIFLRMERDNRRRKEKVEDRQEERAKMEDNRVEDERKGETMEKKLFQDGLREKVKKV